MGAHEEDVKRLAKAIVGTWNISVKDEPSPELPQGETYEGQEIWSEPGGGVVMEQYRAKPSFGEQAETALFWWDNKTQKFKGLWCATINDEGCNGFNAKWESDQFTCDGQWLYNGKQFVWREVWSFSSNSFVQKLYIGGPNGDSKLASTIRATKLISGKKL
ncbi:MAG TPA: hypothetical protein VLK33_12185 [Terriglobales bacterium]|nr:hypothetical protein [Terriglobales bacterium]